MFNFKFMYPINNHEQISFIYITILIKIKNNCSVKQNYLLESLTKKVNTDFSQSILNFITYILLFKTYSYLNKKKT